MQPLDEIFEEGEFPWAEVVPLFVHPVKVAAIEALSWLDDPFSPKQLEEMSAGSFGVSIAAYHMRTLADLGLIEKSHQAQVRGALQTFYRLVRDPRPS
jgi:DNA-binding transcriptional ArsR family regulator